MDRFGERMKAYEMSASGRRFLPFPLLPICARMDGKNFSTLTRGRTRGKPEAGV